VRKLSKKRIEPIIIQIDDPSSLRESLRDSLREPEATGVQASRTSMSSPAKPFEEVK